VYALGTLTFQASSEYFCRGNSHAMAQKHHLLWPARPGLKIGSAQDHKLTLTGARQSRFWGNEFLK